MISNKDKLSKEVVGDQDNAFEDVETETELEPKVVDARDGGAQCDFTENVKARNKNSNNLPVTVFKTRGEFVSQRANRKDNDAGVKKEKKLR